MNARELAALLDGVEYPVRIQVNTLDHARKEGLVIVHGGSDDLMEFAGAITDEADCYGGAIVRLDKAGVIPRFDDVDHEIEACRTWMKRDGVARSIEALWCKEAGYSWTYATDIPHATFEVMEDGDHYCRGIVFAVSDL